MPCPLYYSPKDLWPLGLSKGLLCSVALEFILSFPVPHDDRILARPFMNRGEVRLNWPINHHLKHGVSVKNIY